jgi:hypothetical protein
MMDGGRCSEVQATIKHVVQVCGLKMPTNESFVIGINGCYKGYISGKRTAAGHVTYEGMLTPSEKVCLHLVRKVNLHRARKVQEE